MTSTVPETKNKNIFNIIAAVCFAFCIILLGVNLVLPLIFRNFGIAQAIAPLNVIQFCIHAVLLVFAAITLLAKPMEKLLSISAFLLGAMWICNGIITVTGVIMQLIAINQMGVHQPVTYYSVDFAGVVAAVILAAALIVLGVLFIASQKKNLKKFLCFLPCIVAVISAFFSGLTVFAQVVNTVICFTEQYPHLQTVVTIHSLTVKGITFAEILLYTVAVALIGMSMAKKKSA